MSHWIFSRRNGLCAAVLVVGSLWMVSSLHAQAPQHAQRPVGVVASFAAGGAIDAMARRVAEARGPAPGQPMVIGNKTGGAGNSGAAGVAEGPADGDPWRVGPSATHGAHREAQAHNAPHEITAQV